MYSFVRKRWPLIAAFIILAVVFTCMASYQLVFRRCLLWTCAPKRTFTVADLALPGPYFPRDALVSSMVPLSESFGALESTNMTISWNGGRGRTVYNVRRFATERQASRFYAYYSSVDPYPDYPELSFTSDFADEYKVGCGYSEFGGFRCHLDARYEEFVVALNVTIDSEMSLKQFEDVAFYVDERARKLLCDDVPDAHKCQ